MHELDFPNDGWIDLRHDSHGQTTSLQAMADGSIVAHRFSDKSGYFAKQAMTPEGAKSEHDTLISWGYKRTH